MKSFKKLICMFVMALSITGLCSINAFANDDFEIGTNNLNGTVENSAKIGYVLLKPEKGWKRVDDSDPRIYYSDTFKTTNLDPWGVKTVTLYNGSRHVAELTKDSKITFKFYGSKLRLLEVLSYNRTKKATIKIDDNEPEYCGAYASSFVEGANQTVFYEKIGLEKKIHNVEILLPKDNENWFLLDCLDIDDDGYMLSEETILNLESEKEKINLDEVVAADITIDNIKEIAAEDVIIEYDSQKLKFLGAEEVQGIKVVKSDESEGQLRVILASQGKNNIINSKKTLLRLKFQGIASGQTLIDITKGKISDGIEMERDLVQKECGQATIIIEDYKDPSKNGEFTLLDLAIDGRYYGENPSDLPQYKTDVVENGAIDDEDLIKIGQYMLENPNYSFN